MAKLTKCNGEKFKPTKLTNRIDVPFVLCFKDKLERGFTFQELNQTSNKQFQSFLDKIANLSISEVDKQYRRATDKQDKYGNQQIYHYQVSDSFRIHVIYYEGCYEIIRMDPNHKVHK